MGWECISSDCSIKLFTVSDKIGEAVNNVIGFLQNIAPGMLFLLFITLFAVFIAYLFVYVSKVMRADI